MFPPVQALGLGPTELLIIFAVIVLLFGASKLPDLARGSGRALRIFKAETKGLVDDDDSGTDDEQRPRGAIDSSSSSSGGDGGSDDDTSGSGRHDSTR